MKVLPQRNPTISIRRRIVWWGTATLALSLALFVFVIWFQRSSFGSTSWDFQGATGAATVIPSFAGVILAGWAIYFQIKTSAPSYKAAEQSWLDVSELYHRALKTGALLSTIDIEEPADTDYEPSDADLEAASTPIDEFMEQARAARVMYAKRCASEFKVGMKPDGRQTLATLFLSVAPVLESLQAKADGPKKIVWVQIEADIDFVGETYDADADYQEIARWMNKASSVLRRLIELIEMLFDRGMLNVDAIEDVLLHPILSATNRKWFEQDDAVKEWRSSRKTVFNKGRSTDARI